MQKEIEARKILNEFLLTIIEKIVKGKASDNSKMEVLKDLFDCDFFEKEVEDNFI